MTPDLAQLKALAAVVDEGSFDAAAIALHLTPSAVSQRIKSLEQSAGRVLVRRTKPVEPTDAGQAYLRLARQIDALVHEATATADAEDHDVVVIPIAVNADSLATWLLPALATLPSSICFDLQRDDQANTAELLRSGAVMAAITSVAEAVQGCRSTRLGVMRYRPMASPSFMERWFAGGVDAASLAAAPVVVYDRSDELQDEYLRPKGGIRLTPPRHHIPASADFAAAVRLGLGWGMLPRQQSADAELAGQLVELEPGRHVDVTLHWQRWALTTPALEAVEAAIRAAAADHLDTVG
ncbi:LysR family transcriptional regulator ArgP [Aeromicrobium sp. P5_D10]